MMNSKRTLTALIFLAGCATSPPHGQQYVLKLDAADGSQHQLCYRDADGDPATEPTCKPFTGAPLDSPGTLSVVMTHADPGKTYDLRISSFTTGATPAAVSAHLDQAFIALRQLATFGHSSSSETAAKSPAAASVEAAVASASGTPPASTPPEQLRLADSPPHDPSVDFEDFLDGKKLHSPAQVAGEKGLTNAPEIGSPPPRTIELADQDIAFLKDKDVSIDVLAQHVVDWCSPASFDTDKVKWRARFAAKADLDPDALLKELGLTATAVANAALDNPKAFQEQETRLMDEALDDYSKASPAAKTYFLMHWSVSIQKDLATCAVNLRFMTDQKPGAAVLASIKTTQDDVAKFQALLKPAIDAFAKFAPIFRAASSLVRASSEGRSTLGSFTLQPGTLELGFGEKSNAKGAERREIGTYKVEVDGVERFAITVGPAVLWCKSCFQKLEIKTKPATGEDPAHRQLVSTKESRQYAAVAALHATLYETQRTGFGLLLGYPLTQPADTPKSVLLGIGVRRSSIQFGFGLHMFAVRKPISSYQLPADVESEGNQALTADDVSTEQVEKSWFAYFGYSKGL
jgi:hypothetical protein